MYVSICFGGGQGRRRSLLKEGSKYAEMKNTWVQPCTRMYHTLLSYYIFSTPGKDKNPVDLKTPAHVNIYASEIYGDPIGSKHSLRKF